MRLGTTKIVVIAILTTMFLFRMFCGIFVVQPIGMLPTGATIIYWRHGLNLPFVASADRILDDTDSGVSLLGRGIVLATLAKPIMERKIMSVRYSETLYLISTKGKSYKK